MGEWGPATGLTRQWVIIGHMSDNRGCEVTQSLCTKTDGNAYITQPWQKQKKDAAFVIGSVG